MSNFGARQNRAFYAWQVGIGDDGAFADIDIGNPTQGLLPAIVHAVEVLVPGRTNPFQVGRGLGSDVTGYSCR